MLFEIDLPDAAEKRLPVIELYINLALNIVSPNLTNTAKLSRVRERASIETNLSIEPSKEGYPYNDRQVNEEQDPIKDLGGKMEDKGSEEEGSTLLFLLSKEKGKNLKPLRHYGKIVPLGGREYWKVEKTVAIDIAEKYCPGMGKVEIEGEILSAHDWSLVNCPEGHRDPRRFLCNWFKKIKVRREEGLSSESKLARRPERGDPEPGARRGNERWCAFNRVWVKAENWVPREELIRVHNLFLKETR